MLMQDTDWPQPLRRLVGLRQAGVDLAVFMPQMGRMTAGAHQTVTVNAARIKAEGTDRWADLLKTTMLEGLVRDATLASPACFGFCGGGAGALSPRTLSCPAHPVRLRCLLPA
ncbi:hypothetical protein ACF09Z_38545 [Streptomyces erythrochromogenes]|uniref:hypothetical protein n=1 Tax=Streptomyces erythrochromogenes TaxID=285574 RepID=UPI00370342B0